MCELLFSSKQHRFNHNLSFMPRGCTVFSPRNEVVLDACNNVTVCFDEGNIDDWCVYLNFDDVPDWSYTGTPTARPLDQWIFERFRYVCFLGYDSCVLANQLRDIFEKHLQSDCEFDVNVVGLCKQYSLLYGDYQIYMLICFVLFYYFLIAEDHKAAREVGCCITMYAAYVILKDSNVDIDDVCYKLHNMKADYIRRFCHKVGIFHNASPKLKDKKIAWNW